MFDGETGFESFCRHGTVRAAYPSDQFGDRYFCG